MKNELLVLVFLFSIEMIMAKNKSKIIESEQFIVSQLKNKYGLDVINSKFLSLGADVEALIYKIETSDHSNYFVKLKKGEPLPFDLPMLLHDEGIEEVIPPVKALDEQAKLFDKGFTLIVYPFVNGRDGFGKSLTDDQWVIFGKTLKRIHQFKIPSLLLPLIKREKFSSEWRDNVRSIYENLDKVIPSSEIAAQFLVSLEKHKSLILELVDKAQKLSEIIPKQPKDFVLCHGDIHAGNVLITGSGALYVIDWDEPLIAPQERDLMFMGGGVGNVWNNKREGELFYFGYGQTKINKNLVNYYRCDRILKDIVDYYQELLLNKGEYKDRLTSFNQFRAFFESNGVIDIALKS